MTFFMKKKYIIIILSLIFLILISIYGVSSVLIPHILSNKIENYFTEKLNLKIYFENISFNIFNGNTLFRKIKISNQFGQSIVEVDSIKSKLNYFKLFRKNPFIYADSVAIEKMKLFLELKDGKSNIDFLFPKTGSTLNQIEYSGSDIFTADASKEEEAKLSYLLKNIQFINCQICFAFNESNFSIDNINLNIEKLDSSEVNIKSFLNFFVNKNSNFNNRIVMKENIIEINSDIKDFDLTFLNNILKSYYAGLNIINSIVAGNLQTRINKDESNFKISGELNFNNSVIEFNGDTFCWDTLYMKMRDLDFIISQYDIEKIDIHNFKTNIDYAMKFSTGSDVDTTILQNTEIIAQPIQQETAPQIPAPDVVPKSIELNIDYLNVYNSHNVFNIKTDSDPLTIIFDKTNLNLTNLQYSPAAISFTANYKGIVQSKASFEGKINYENKYTNSILVSLKNLSLPELNPLIRYYTGYIFNIGKMELASATDIADSIVYSKNDIKIYSPELVKIDDRLDVPLEVIFDILKDKNDVVNLSLPVNGSLDDPKFSFKESVLAFLKSLAKKMISYPVKYIINVFKIKDENFYKIPFNFNNDMLDDIAKKRLDIIGEILNKKTKFIIELNFYSTNQELKGKDIKSVFKKRIRNVENYLKDNFNIELNRILYKEIRNANINVSDSSYIELKISEIK